VTSPTDQPGAPVELARADGVLGELVLRRRRIDGRAVVELVSNGVLLMDSADTSTERRLAAEVLARVDAPAPHLLVGGLGLGYTVAAALADPRPVRVTVVEVEPDVVRWVGAGLVPDHPDLLAHPRVDVLVGDVADVLGQVPPGSLDAVLLDVDNGPHFLVHPGNARVYGSGVLDVARAALRPGGLLAVWSGHEAPDLAERLVRVCGRCDVERLTVRRSGRDLEYLLYLGGTPRSRGTRRR
jgi:spermidine synthase